MFLEQENMAGHDKQTEHALKNHRVTDVFFLPITDLTNKTILVVLTAVRATPLSFNKLRSGTTQSCVLHFHTESSSHILYSSNNNTVVHPSTNITPT